MPDILLEFADLYINLNSQFSTLILTAIDMNNINKYKGID